MLEHIGQAASQPVSQSVPTQPGTSLQARFAAAAADEDCCDTNQEHRCCATSDTGQLHHINTGRSKRWDARVSKSLGDVEVVGPG